jgi:hypothetical protein
MAANVVQDTTILNVAQILAAQVGRKWPLPNFSLSLDPECGMGRAAARSKQTARRCAAAAAQDTNKTRTRIPNTLKKLRIFGESQLQMIVRGIRPQDARRQALKVRLGGSGLQKQQRLRVFGEGPYWVLLSPNQSQMQQGWAAARSKQTARRHRA